MLKRMRSVGGKNPIEKPLRTAKVEARFLAKFRSIVLVTRWYIHDSPRIVRRLIASNSAKYGPIVGTVCIVDIAIGSVRKYAAIASPITYPMKGERRNALIARPPLCLCAGGNWSSHPVRGGKTRASLVAVGSPHPVGRGWIGRSPHRCK